MTSATTEPVRFLDLGAMHAEIRDEMHAAVIEALERGDYILGEAVARFEEEFARYCGVTHALGVDSGTSALELALRAAGVSPGDEVILPANTFVATALAVHHAGAVPVLVDVDPEDLQPRSDAGGASRDVADEGRHSRAPVRAAGGDGGDQRLGGPARPRGRRRRPARRTDRR